MDLVFYNNQGNVYTIPLPRSDHFLVGCRLKGSQASAKVGGRVNGSACSCGLMAPTGFLNALGEFPGNRASDPAEALASLSNSEIRQADDTHNCSLLLSSF